MAPLYDGNDYYKKMLELQEKLRKSEEERIRLEERFKTLVQNSRSRHDACLNRLRLRYIEFLEERRMRDERNHKLLGALDRVDSSLALMTAKTDRLNVLRKQYEAYLLRVYANRGPPGSITGDSGIASQNEDRSSRRNIRAGQANLISPEIKSISLAQTYQPNHYSNQSASFAAPKLNESVRAVSYDNRQTLESTPLGAQTVLSYPATNIHRSQNALQTQVDPRVIQRNNGHQFLQSRNFPPETHRKSQTFYSSNPQSRNSHNFRADTSTCVRYVTSPVPQIGPLNQQNVPQLNKSSTEQMEIVQSVPHLVMFEPTNGSVSQFKSLHVSQNEIAPTISQHQFNPSSIAQSVRPYNSELPLDNSPVQIRRNDRVVSPALGAAPMITESNLSGTTLSYTPRNSAKQTGPLPSYLDYSLAETQNVRQSVGEIPARLLTSSDVDDMIKRNEELMSKHLNDRRTPLRFTSTVRESPTVEEEGRTMTNLENELDRYIGKIKNLHRELDMQSLEGLDHEQNTSGDLLNVTLSDDDLEIPAEGKPKEELPKEVKKVLALASDLASRTIDSNVIDNSVKQEGSENVNQEVKTMQSNPAISERIPTVVPSDTHEGLGTSTRLAKDEICSDITIHPPKLDQRENIEKPVKHDSSGPSKPYPSDLQSDKLNVLKKPEGNEDTDSILSPADKILEEIDKNNSLKNEGAAEAIQKENNIHAGVESKLEENSFDIAEELEPWNLEDMEKEVQEIQLIDVDKNQSTEKQTTIEVTAPSDSNVKENESSDKLDSEEDTGMSPQVQREDGNPEIVTAINEVEDLSEPQAETDESTKLDKNTTGKDQLSRNTESSESNNPKSDGEMEGQIDRMEQNSDLLVDNADNNQKQDNQDENDEYNANKETPDINQSDQAQVEGQEGEGGLNQQYAEEPSQAQNYAQDSNEAFNGMSQEYAYDQTTPYEGNPGEEYQEYANQGYAQESNEQYNEYVDQQYNQYNVNPDGQYAQDPNAQYEQDPNQQYTYNYDQQYDPNQVYETDPNQSYEYGENASYDPDQVNATQVQENMENQNYGNFQEDFKSGGTEETAEEKTDAIQSKSQEEPLETNEPKKKKDVIKSLLDSDTESTIERNVSNTESDFDFN